MNILPTSPENLFYSFVFCIFVMFNTRLILFGSFNVLKYLCSTFSTYSFLLGYLAYRTYPWQKTHTQYIITMSKNQLQTIYKHYTPTYIQYIIPEEHKKQIDRFLSNQNTFDKSENELSCQTENKSSEQTESEQTESEQTKSEFIVNDDTPANSTYNLRQRKIHTDDDNEQITNVSI